MAHLAEITTQPQNAGLFEDIDFLLGYLRSKNYRPLISFLNTNCREVFRTQRSGETFEYWVDWCAQNAGSVDDAKQILLDLFAAFYDQLPPIAKLNLSYLADEIGYRKSRTFLDKLDDLGQEVIASLRATLRPIVMLPRNINARLRKARLPQVRVTFREPARTKQEPRIPIEELIRSTHRSITSK